MTATVGIRNGTLVKVYVDGTAIANTTSHTFTVTQATRETTNKDSAGCKETMEGIVDWTMDGDFLQAEDAAYGFSELFALITNRTKVTLKFTSNVSSDKYLQGDARLVSLDESAPLEDNISGSFSFEGTGKIVEKTYT